MLKEKFLSHSPIISNLSKLDSRELELYESHFSLLKNWNERMALVSKKSIEKSFATHYMDSIFISDFAESKRKEREVYDLGTGAGFPGVVYAIRYPKAKVTLFERSLKKQTFLSAVLTSLNIDNLTLLGDMLAEKRKGLFLARAVLPPPELFKFMSKRMTEGSTLIVNVGGSREPLNPPMEFLKTGELCYELPMESGGRRVESFDFVPRGTK